MKDLDELLGGPIAFYEQMSMRLQEQGIDTRGMAISQVAYRCKTYREYLQKREGIEQFAIGNVENIWNGRPISKILLAKPLRFAADVIAEIIELIPPIHDRGFRMGLEHIGFVVGDEYAGPKSIEFADLSHAKFVAVSLREICEKDGHRFDCIQHVEWVPDDIDAGPYA